MPWKIFGQISLKSGVYWTRLKEHADLTEDEIEKSIIAAVEVPNNDDLFVKFILTMKNIS